MKEMKQLHDRDGFMPRGNINEYLGMKLDYTQKGKVIIGMVDYVESMVKSFSKKDLHGTKVKMPWNDHAFKVRDKNSKLLKSRAVKFHKVTVMDSSHALVEDWKLIVSQSKGAVLMKTIGIN